MHLGYGRRRWRHRNLGKGDEGQANAQGVVPVVKGVQDVIVKDLQDTPPPDHSRQGRHNFLLS